MTHTYAARTALFALSLTIGIPALAEAQAPTARPQGCTYATCALRVRAATFTRPPILVRGAAEEELSGIGSFGDAVAPWFQASDSAYAQAQRYDRLGPISGVLNIAGTAMLILGPILTDWSERPGSTAAIFLSGLGLTLYGGELNNRAQDALSRAVWHYNATLPR